MQVDSRTLMMRTMASLRKAALSLCLTGGLALVGCAEASAQPVGPAKRFRIASGPPNFDIARTCRGATGEIGRTPKTCLYDEESARSELAKGWSGYPPAERTRCSELASLPEFESYVELITCLELAAQVKAMRK
jgi:hypothetical protein